MRQILRVIHTSDVHLDNESHGDHHSAHVFRSVVSAVNASSADLFLIAGDLFDHNRVRPRTLDFVHEQLARVRCPTVLIPGNHDCFNEKSVYRRWNPEDAGRHVTMLLAEHGDVVHFDDLHATVWGRAMVEHEPANKPMLGVPERHEDRWHIGMAHGHFVEDETSMRSSLITPSEIASSGLDYLALGHVHVTNDVSQGDTRALYCGSPQHWHAGSGVVASITLDPNAGVDIDTINVEVPVELAAG